MSIQSINEIKNAEQQAEQMLTDAKAQAYKIVADAQSEASLNIKQTKKKAASIEESAVLKYTDSAQEQIEAINRTTRETLEKLGFSADEKMDRIVEFIVDRIVNV